MASFDYIVIGAGSAGSVLANRLSADPNNKVLLLEAGGKDNSVMVRMPAGIGQILSTKTRFNWWFYTEGQQHLAGRRLYWPRGKTLGGSSSINGMIYIRGHARDYDMWRQMGLQGWGYSDCLPYFMKAETSERGADDFHGDEGPLHVQTAKSSNPLFRTYIEAGFEAGYKKTEDFNGFQQEGFGPYDTTIKNGERWSTARGYLTPILDRPNLTIEVNAQSTRILFEKGRAIGVEYVQKKEKRQAWANAEVILSGGVINSPQLLLLSGIGDGDYLKKFGLPVVHDLPGVGQNLQDHLDCSVGYESKQPITAYAYTKPLASLKVGLQYLLNKSGPGAFQHLESGAFLKSRPDLEVPDLQFHFVAALMENHGMTKLDRHGFISHVCQLRPESRGHIGLRSTNPLDAPLIQPNYLSAEVDRITMREGVKMSRDIFEQKAFDVYRGPEAYPGSEVRTDEQIDKWIQKKAETIYHPIGTCKMGNDPMAVVDENLKVRGVDGLRVVDASVMPTLVGGNTNAPTIMIAEKISDNILGKSALAPMDVRVAEDVAEMSAAQ